MHDYLRSIGFSDLTKEKLDDLIYEMIRNPDGHDIALDSEGNEYVEIRYEVAKNIGIALRGTYDKNDEFHVDYYYPYCQGKQISTEADTEIIKQSDRESYQGLSDDVRLGVNLIFYLQNMMEFLKKRNPDNQYDIYSGAVLGGLSERGKILLPIKKTEPFANATKLNNERNHLMKAARDGDEEAIEHLTIEDMDTYSMISRRIDKEDVLSIVSSYFMPYGIESDKYSVLGDITEWHKYTNEITGEKLYLLTVECNDIVFDVCINENDLLGEPAVGRRFKGTVWMQGMVDIDNL